MSFKERCVVAGVLTMLACVASPRASQADVSTLPVADSVLSYQVSPSTSSVPSVSTTDTITAPTAAVPSVESENEDDGVIEELLAVDEAATCSTAAEVTP